MCLAAQVVRLAVLALEKSLTNDDTTMEAGSLGTGSKDGRILKCLFYGLVVRGMESRCVSDDDCLSSQWKIAHLRRLFGIELMEDLVICDR